MTNLKRLLISHIHMPDLEQQEEGHVVQITSQFLRLHHVRDLHLESPFYLEGCLDQMLRCLKTPLDNLGITHCLLTNSDLTHLSQSPNISQLKGLDLSGVTMTYSSPELLPALLEKVSATLQELYLEQSGIRDSHLESILHILSRCFQLMSFSLRGNLLSMAILEKLLRHTSGLPRKFKLRVLDLRNTGQDFWRMWSGSSVHVSSSSSMAPMAEDGSRIEKRLAVFEVFTELHLKERTMNEFLTYLLNWVEQRDPFIHLCCKKLKIVSFPMDNIMNVLSMVQLDCIQELHVNCTWHLSTLAMIAPLLGQMSNVQKLFVSYIHLPDPEEWNEQHIVKITSQFLRLHHLQDLHLESPFYLEGCLDQMLRLLDLAAMSLLRKEDLAMSALEFLPIELFPPLFMEAFYGSHSKTLKTMVHAWPFVRLPLGGLMELPHLITLQAVLDGLDVLLTQKERPRRCKLRVLDLRNTGQNFWSMWSGYTDHMSSSLLVASVPQNRSRTEQPLAPLEVFVEMSLKEWAMDEFLTYLMRWAEERKDSIHLCCKKLKIFGMPVENTMKVLSMVQLDCIQDVEVNQNWHLSSLATFAPLLGQMSNVQRLILSASEEQEQHVVVQFTSQFLKLHHLRDLYLESPFFLSGRLDQMLRCLMSPLDNLAITHCLLTESDLTHLSQCPSISQLKGLDLSGITVADFSPELLQVLLEQVADTLQVLDLNQCEIMDSQIEAILPALSHCSQLRSFSMCGNLLSMAAMEKLLRHTSGLPSLSQEFYPAPLESNSSQAVLSKERLAQLRAELLEILRNLGHPRTIWLNFVFFASHDYDKYSHLEIIEYVPA
ncbi:hypothetical protein MJG53_011268 [Ovis ammon polii x Ovis aries]|uniref:Uncharacterized protein n=1 Tax=Ovis ammon polii x Ovis aries TaxID=2918886 RepID=A0ACB9US69_9CETA|nr:hypothetical protein MJG53_011268 [Ovis ammon polii x Ovis aries]